MANHDLWRKVGDVFRQQVDRVRVRKVASTQTLEEVAEESGRSIAQVDFRPVTWQLTWQPKWFTTGASIFESSSVISFLSGVCQISRPVSSTLL